MKTSHILCVSSIGTSIYLHPTDCGQVRPASAAVWCSVTGSRLPAALAPRGFGTSWTCVAFTLLDYFTSMSLLHWLLLKGIEWITSCRGEFVRHSLQLCMSVAPDSSTEEITAEVTWQWILRPKYFIFRRLEVEMVSMKQMLLWAECFLFCIQILIHHPCTKTIVLLSPRANRSVRAIFCVSPTFVIKIIYWRCIFKEKSCFNLTAD